MKKLILLPILGLASIASSCRTAAPLDPNTMKPTDRDLPANYHVSPAKIQPTK
jgi:hypothetical protein